MKAEEHYKVLIRKAMPDDYEAVSVLEDLEFKIHQQARPDYFKNMICYSKEEFDELLALPCPICWLAILNKQIVGLCFGKIAMTSENKVCKSRHVTFIEDLIVLPEYRGHGIGTALMARARKQAVDEGSEAIELCVWSFNQNALRLYEQLGMNVQYYRIEENLTV